MELPSFRRNYSSVLSDKLTLIVLLFCLMILPAAQAHAYNFEKVLTQDEAETVAKELAKDSYFVIKERFYYPADDDLLLFLFEHLDFTGWATRAWDITELKVIERKPKSFSAKIRDNMEGVAFRLTLEKGTTRYSGMGSYRAPLLPFNLQARAWIELTWTDAEDKFGSEMVSTLRLHPSNRIIRMIGWTLYPLIESHLVDQHRRVIRLGKKLGRKLRRHPHETTEKLESLSYHHAKVWKSFLENHPDFGTSDR